MDEIDNNENRIYDHRVYNDEMNFFENNNYNSELIIPNDSVSVLSVLDSLITNSSTNLDTNSSTNLIANSSTTNSSFNINVIKKFNKATTSKNRSP
ncbi:1972_t:CDS:1, partial [Dentiscutata heterogama]